MIAFIDANRFFFVSFSIGFSCLRINRRRIDYEVFLVSRKHAIRSNRLEVQLVVLHRLQGKFLALRLKPTSLEELSTDEIALLLQQTLQENRKWNARDRR